MAADDERARALAEGAYRGLVWDDPDFVDFFRRSTPIEEIGHLELGSRPARRGTGTASTRGAARHPVGLCLVAGPHEPAGLVRGRGRVRRLAERQAMAGRTLAEAYRAGSSSARWWTTWSSAWRSPIRASRPLRRAGRGRSGDAAHRGRDEYERAANGQGAAALTGRKRLLEESPRLRRSIDVRTPYVDVLSELQVHALGSDCDPPISTPPSERTTEELLQLTIGGVAAGLQHTG